METEFDEHTEEQPVEEGSALSPLQPLHVRLQQSRGLRVAAAVLSGLAVGGLCVFGFFYVKFGRRIDGRLTAGPFAGTLNVYSAPKTVMVGDSLTIDEVVSRLKNSGYTTSRGNFMGWYRRRAAAVEVFPGRDSYVGGSPGMLEFANGKISRIVSLDDHTPRQSFALEPQLIANLSPRREKRRMVRFAEIPPSLVHAVISVEDQRFFQHSGFDPFRILKAAYVDVKGGKKAQGASTLSMQLARGFWLAPRKSWRRKLEELFLTMQLEHRLTKQQIFEDYANQIYLGRSGSFSVNGFGEGALNFFGKDLAQVNDAEAALLAGIVQRPSFYNPYRYPDRARERRNVVLAKMRQNGYLSEERYRKARDAPLGIAPAQARSQDGQYFVDLMNDELQDKLDENAKPVRAVFTTLDPTLQAAAEEAVLLGTQNVDRQLHRKNGKAAIPAGEPQVALVALDPRTGAIVALVGGRDYRASQLNHALAMRQPGSVFKPFVYAAALDTAVQGGKRVFTPASIMDDQPATFNFGNVVYEPGNFNREFMGEVTLRTALAHSLNVVAVSLAQQVGYDKVVAMARRAGLNDAIEPTPSVALGSYETTPLEIAGAYTMFANQGLRATPTTIALTRANDGSVIFRTEPGQQRSLDPRVNFLMVSMMQDVLRIGTGAGVRSLGFTQPAAGKTGTSHDGWFAGFTSELLCVVWVGFDDNRELNLEGARSALPIWAEFMKRASKLREYRDARPFQPPPGVAGVKICAASGQLAGDYCPETRSDYFINGTAPAEVCEMHSLNLAPLAGRLVDAAAAVPADRP